MRILLAGVPFGCDNVGDEAILECAVQIFREAVPEALITASTRDQERTAQRLGIETCALLGFHDHVTPAAARAIIAEHDCFVWCGATGLSDYPQMTTKLMRAAQQLGKMTILWGVGMNDELNPAFYRLQAGRRMEVVRVMERATFGMVKWGACFEACLAARAKRSIAGCLNHADLIVVRDAESRDELVKCGVTKKVIMGADSAILMQPGDLADVPLPPGIRDLLLSDETKIGLCVSAQGKIRKEREFAACLDQLVEEAKAHIVCIPMNPLTDSAVMARLAGHMAHRDRILVLTGEYQPTEIATVASCMNVVISSRLHLLILSTVAGVPIVGVTRGSKIRDYLAHFGLSPVGSVDNCNFESLKSEVHMMLQNAQLFRDRCAKTLAQDLRRMGIARQEMAKNLAKGD